MLIILLSLVMLVIISCTISSFLKWSFVLQAQLTFRIQALFYNTTGAYFKCSLGHRLCALKLFFLEENVAILASGPRKVKNFTSFLLITFPTQLFILCKLTCLIIFSFRKGKLMNGTLYYHMVRDG